MRTWARISLIVIATSLLSEAALATGGATISPFMQEISVNAGQPQVSFPLHIRNDQDTPQSLQLRLIDFKSLDESGGVAFQGLSYNDIQNKYGLAAWMSVDAAQFTLQPKEDRVVQVHIQNRDDLAPGGHYGAILVDQAELAADSQLVLRPAFASLVFLTKLGGEQYQIDLDSVRTNSETSTAYLTFRNGGNVHLIPRGTVKLLNPFGQVVSRGVINPESALLLPETKRTYDVSLNQVARSRWPGRYTLVVDYRYDGRQDFYSYSKSLWRGSLALVFTALLLIGLAIGIVVWLNKRKKTNKRS